MTTQGFRDPARVEGRRPRHRDADLALIHRFLAGDRSAFDRLVVKYEPRIMRLVARYVSDPSEAQDVAQEVFLRAYRSARSFRGQSALYTWLYRIAVNTAKNHLTRASRRPPYSGVLDASEAGDFYPELSDFGTPEKIALIDEATAAVDGVIRSLPDELRTALLFRESGGMSYRQIAYVLRCPVGTVRSRIFRARKAIDAKLTAMG